MDRQQEYVLRVVEERDIRFIQLWFTDVHGDHKSVATAHAWQILQPRSCRRSLLECDG